MYITKAISSSLNIIYKILIFFVRWTNPFYILLTPFAYIARLCHQMPILLNTTERKIRSISHNKYNIVALPTDANFIQDRWQSFQYIEWRFTDVLTCAKCRERADNWSMDNFKCKANFIESDWKVKEYIETITRKKPSQVIINSTHLIVYFKNTLVMFLDHYFCDGLTLTEIMKHMFYEENISSKVFPKYINYPLLSDYIAVEYFGRMFINNIKYPSLINGIANKTCVMTEILQKNEQIPWNRWTIYAHGINRIFEALPNIDYLRVGLTVGFDTHKTFGNNRIGIIIAIIKRLPHCLSYNEKMLNYMEQFKIQTLTKMNDANTSYDIVRSYNMSYIRSSKMNRVVDIYFTSLFFKQEHIHNVTGIGGFVGKLTSAENIYISGISFGSTSYFTYVSNCEQLNVNHLTSKGITLEYEFDNNDPNQF